jgi:hypothetical protein
MAGSLRIPSQFNGPLKSGNGGYSAGAVAAFVEGPAQVSLRAPVPLDRSLRVAREDDGSLRVLDGEILVAEAGPVSDLALEVPAAVSTEEARAAATRYRGLPDGIFSRCFVCGRAREDAFGVFAGTVEGRQLVASPWTPPHWTADASGTVRSEFVWAVLDCPTFFATYMDEDLGSAVLARLAARIDAPIVADDEHVVIAWPIEIDRRKRHAGSAVLSGDGKPLAIARALLVEPRAGEL